MTPTEMVTLIGHHHDTLAAKAASIAYHGDGDDLLAAAIDRAIAKAHLFDGADLIGWMIRLMVNVRTDTWRAATRERELVGGAPSDHWTQVAAHVATNPEIADPATTARLHAALGALRPERREVFVEVVVHDRTYAEVADRLGIPRGTVMSRLSRARADLRALLADLDPTGESLAA